jgi:hypothetical protein
VDLFASRINFQGEKYVSWQPDPNSIAVDCFTINWYGYDLLYAFPPFAVIPLILQKIIHDKARVLMVVPYWPTRPWFTRFTSLLESIPILISVTDDVLYLPFSKKKHPMVGKLSMIVGICSGNRMNPEVTRTKLFRPSSNQRDKVLHNHMKFTGNNGEHFVVNNQLIYLNQVLVKL